MGSLRISLGSTNTAEQMPIVAGALARAVAEELHRTHKIKEAHE